MQHGLLRYKVTRDSGLAAASSPASTAIVIASGTRAVPADGRFTIHFTADEPTPDRSGRGASQSTASRGSPAAYRFRAAVELWADDGSSAVARSAAFGTVLMQADIRSEREFLRSDEPSSWRSFGTTWRGGRKLGRQAGSSCVCSPQRTRS